MFKKGLEQAAKRSYETRDSFGESSDYLKKGVKIQKWTPKDGDHIINIIPYIAGENCPNQTEGYATHVLDIWVHQRVGPSSSSHVCLAKNFKKPCPICDLQREMRKDGGFSEDDIKALQPKRRTLYNVVVLDTVEEERKSVQIWEVSFHFMEKHLAQLAKNPRGGGFVPFQDPDTGKSISWTIEGKGGYNKEYVGHRFVDRDSEVTDEQLEEAQTLDEIIHIPDYKELQKVAEMVRGGLSAEDEEGQEEEEEYEEEEPKEEKRKGKKTRKPEPEEEPEEEEEEPWEEEEEEEPEPPKKKGKAAPPKRRKPEPEPEEEEEEEPEEEEEEEDEEPEPPKKVKKPLPARRKAKPEPEEEPDEEEEEEPEDEPEPPKKTIKKPAGRLRR
jgi:hypothetical protein